MPSNWLGFKLAKWFPELAKKEVLRFWIISFFTFIPLNVAVVVACFWLLRLFNFSEGIAGLTSIVYLLGTSVLSYAQVPQQNNQVLLFVILGYACVLSYLKHRRFYWIFLCGLSLGFAVLIRSTSIIHCLSVGMFLLGCVLYQSYNIRHLFKILLLYLVGLIPFNLVRYFSNYLRLGSFFKSGLVIARDTVNTDPIYNNLPLVPADFPFTTPMYEGILGILFSPAKSIFIYDPLLIPCLILLGIYWRRLSFYILWYSLVSLLNLTLFIFLFSKLVFWTGDAAWAARYQVTSLHLLLIPLLGIFVQGILSSRHLKKWVLSLVLILSISVQVLSVTFPFDLPIRQENINATKAGYYNQKDQLSFRIGKQIENIIIKLSSSHLNANQIKNLSRSNQLAIKYMNINFQPFRFRASLIKNQNQNLEMLSLLLIGIWYFIFISAIIMTFKFCWTIKS
jgi:hypothetical protein